MPTSLETYVILVNVVTLLCGGLVTVLAWRAYRRTKATALAALSGGLGLVTIGAFLAGVLHQIAGFAFAISIAIQSTFTALGFAVLAYSLYARWEDDRSGQDQNPEVVL